MADNTAIEWSNSTWNPIAGCSILSPGCTNCYAMGMAARIEKMMAALGKPTPYAGLTQPSKAGPVWNGRIAVASDETLTQPLRWKRPRRIFVNSMSDLFHEGVADEIIDRVFAVMALCPQHTFQVLTKRAQRMREYSGSASRRVARACVDLLIAGQVKHTNDWPVQTVGDIDDPDDLIMKDWPLPNVWLGVSTEDQARADERIPHLLATPAAVRFISAEPLLGAINFRWATWDDWKSPIKGVDREGTTNELDGLRMLDWVIAGGESGPKARPSHPDWFRALRDQCAAAGVPYFLKQWGEWTPRENVERTKGVVETATWFGGEWSFDREDLANEEGHVDDQPDLYRVGKKAAGATLDGKMHREFPT